MPTIKPMDTKINRTLTPRDNMSLYINGFGMATTIDLSKAQPFVVNRAPESGFAALWARALTYGPVFVVFGLILAMAVLTMSGSSSSRQALIQYYDTGYSASATTCNDLCDNVPGTNCYEQGGVIGYGFDAGGTIVQTVRKCNQPFQAGVTGTICACQGPLTQNSSLGFTSY
jgi:hypothetical protein